MNNKSKKTTGGDKEINNILLTDNAGVFRDVLQQLLIGDDFVALSNMNKDVLAKTLKKLSDCDETINPAMLPLLSLFFVKLPSEAIDTLDSYPSKNNTPILDFFNDFYGNMEQWIKFPENIDLLFDFNKMVALEGDGDKISRQITKKERTFLEKARGDRKNEMRRLKILSASQAHTIFCALNELLDECRQQGDPRLIELVLATMRLTTFAIRNMVQFSACYVAHDGINRQQGRKNQPDADKRGLEELTRNIMASHPRSSQPELWNAARIKLTKEKVFEFEDYTVEFCQDPSDYRKNPGTLIQKDLNGKEYPITFSAFKKMVSKLKNDNSY